MGEGLGQPIVFIDDAHTFGGAQIALGWAVRAILRNTAERIVCVCTPRTRAAVEAIAGEHARLEFIDCPVALPLNILTFPIRLAAFFPLMLGLWRRGVRAWWMNLSGIEFCLAPLLILRLLGEHPRAWLHNVQRFSFYQPGAALARRVVNKLRDAIADHLLFNLYPVIITPSQASAKLLCNRIAHVGRAGIGHLHPTVGRATKQGEADPAASSAEDGVLDLWMIGRVEYAQKNNLAALDVMDVLRAQGRSVRLSVIGDGPDMEDFKSSAIRRKVDNSIDYFGWRANPWALVPDKAVVLMPSVFEGMPLVAIEAMLNGTRIVTSPLAEFMEGVPKQMVAEDFSACFFADKIIEVSSMAPATVHMLYEAELAKFSEATFAERFLFYSGL